MTTRRALVWLVLAVLVPVVLAGVVSLVSLYRAQHAAHGARVLERVRALRIALDVEIAATQRMLATVAERAALRQDSVSITPELADGLRRLAQANEMWATVTIVERDGSERLRVDREGASARASDAPAPRLDDATLQRILSTGLPQLSPLAGVPGGPLYTYVAVPVVKDRRVARVVCVAIPQQAWLAFLARFPVDPDATLTLNDAAGRIVARTRDNGVWAGQVSRPEYWRRTQQAGREAYFPGDSLEGTAFLSAFSRLDHGGWVLGTGVPAEAINRAVWSQAALIGLLFAAAVAAALLGALVIGRGIARTLHELAALASAVHQADRHDANGRAAPRALPLDEAEAVRTALRKAFIRESEARQAAEQARAAREQFVATLAHELRNPLGAIHNAQLLMEREPDNAETSRRATGILKRQVAQLRRVMADLFEASRPADAAPSVRFSRVDLAQVCRDAVDALQTEGRLDHVALTVDLPPVTAWADAARMHQVVANLLDNAGKFTPARGAVHLALAREGDEAVLTVNDSGVGMRADLLESAFEPFERGESTDGRGLGLGLHVVKRIVELHGGTVRASSGGIGQGTTVVVRIPARIANGASIPESTTVDALPPRGPVDDSPTLSG